MASQAPSQGPSQPRPQIRADASGAEQQLDRPEAIKPHGPSPAFYLLCGLFNAILALNTKGVKSKQAKGKTKRDFVAQFFARWREDTGKDLYPVMRLMMPDKDRHRWNYGLKEAKLAKAYARALELDSHTKAYKKLENWKVPTSEAAQNGAGDLASVAFEVIESRNTLDWRTNSDPVTIDQVNDFLEQLSKAKNDKENAEVLSRINQVMSADEQRWLIRIILKDLKIGMGERVILAVFHPDAMEHYNTCSDIKKVCYDLWDEDKRLPQEKKTTRIFEPFKPMLCKRGEISITDIRKKMLKGNDAGTFYIEEKMDGERIQLHMKVVKGGTRKYKYFSRKDTDYTYLYGATKHAGSLTPHIDDIWDPRIEEIILDGEMQAWDPVSERYLAFGSLKTTAISQKQTFDPNTPRPCLRVFDVLWIKVPKKPGSNGLKLALESRKKLLNQFIKPREKRGHLQIVNYDVATEVEQITHALITVMSRFGEGLVVKNPRSGYILNDRDDGWYKIKPDYMEKGGEEFSLAVIGACWGEGKRGGSFGSLFLGVRVDPEEKGKEPKYQSFCKVGSGMRYEHKTDMERFLHHFKTFPRQTLRPNAQGFFEVDGLLFKNERPDVYINPRNSFAADVIAAEIIKDEDGMAAGMCLRFPRFRRVWAQIEYCHEHKADEQMSMEDLVQRSLTPRADPTSLDRLDAHRRRLGPRKKIKAPIQLQPEMMGIDSTKVTRVSSIFRDFYCWIVEGPIEVGQSTAKLSKNELETIYVANGGKLCQGSWAGNEDRSERYTFGRSPEQQTSLSSLRKKVPVINPQYILDCVKAGRRLPVTESYVVAVPSNTSAAAIASGSKRKLEQAGHDQDEYEDEMDEDDDDERDEQIIKQVKAQVATLPGLAPLAATTTKRLEQLRLDDDSDATASEPDDDRDDEDVKPDLSSINTGPGSLSVVSTPYNAVAGPGMGHGDVTMQEDAEKFFHPRVFYLDTLENATRLGFAHLDKAISVKTELWVDAVDHIETFGGRITEELTDPTLTHIIVHRKDFSRVQELFQRVNVPALASSVADGGGGKRSREILTVDWILDCGDEETYIYEDDKPEYRPV